MLGTDGPVEYSLRGIDPATRLPIRCRIDKLLTSPLTVVDIKTTADPLPDRFARDVVTYGYHRQLAWYGNLARAAVPSEDVSHVLVAVRNVPPFECQTYAVADSAIRLGAAENRRLLQELARRLDGDAWHHDGWGRDLELDLPPWAYKE